MNPYPRRTPALVATISGCLGLTLLLTFGCVDERLDDICARVQDCGGLRSRDFCESRLGDALSDGRTSPPQAAGCAVCASNADNDCEALLVTRDCDTACSGIDLITDMYTTPNDRRSACQASDELCQIPSNRERVHACVASLAEQITQQPKLDLSLSQCVSCLRSAVDAANAAQSAKPDSQGATSVTAACSANTCAAPCTNFQGLIAALADEARVAFICQTVAVTCQASSHFTLSRDECVAGLSAASAPSSILQTCAACVGSSGSCNDLFPDESGEGGQGGAPPDLGCNGACATLPGFAP